jgi:hypothetical protein
MIKDRRMGRFRVSVELLDKGSDALKSFMSSVLILRAEYDFSFDAVEYMGIHERFRELAEGDAAPYYDIIFTKIGGDEGRVEYGMEFKEI